LKILNKKKLKKKEEEKLKLPETNNPSQLNNIIPINDDEDELKPYDLTDDEADLNPIKLPKYIRELLQNLRAQDDVNKLHGALKAATSLILSKPDDLNDISIPILSTLLHLHNEYNIEQFQLMRHQSMVALLVTSTDICLPCLHN